MHHVHKNKPIFCYNFKNCSQISMIMFDR